MVNGEAFLWRHERLYVAGLCVLAAIRVFVFGAAFPLFNNVDEISHYDLVLKYAAGRLPDRCIESFEQTALDRVSGYGSPEYFFDPGRNLNAVVAPPTWNQTPETAAARILKLKAGLRLRANTEMCSPPLYYIVAALWYRLGEGAGFGGARLIYWIRFLNLPAIVALVLLGRRFAVRFLPEDRFVRFATPLLIALFPQDTFFSINSDVLSPLTFGLALYLLIAVNQAERGSWLFALAGLCVAAAMLTKISNWAIVPLAIALIFRRVYRDVRAGSWGGAIVGSGAFLAAAGAPVLAWMARNQLVMGDALGTAEKTSRFGWVVLPMLERFGNPIFHPSGAADFLLSTIRTFWRGEFVWHSAEVASGSMDAVYVVTSLAFLLLPAIGLLRSREDPGGSRRFVLVASYASLGVFMVFLVWASIRFDYRDCFYPSQQRPYLRSGRLMLGALVPCAVLYLNGLRRSFSAIARIVPPLVLVLALVVTITAGEIVLTTPVFRSAYNWYHLP